ncbi:Phage Tail Collar Domain protein [compost metagenome]
MVAFPVDKVAPGFLEVDGSVKSIAAYPDLAAFLGTTFNKGDEGAGNFRLPELRGEFLRGWDHGRGIDAGRAVGSWRGAQTEDHAHVTGLNDTSLGPSMQSARGAGSWPYGVASIGIPGTNSVSTNVIYAASGEDSWLKTGPNIPLGTGETSPRNLAVMWCIKAWSAPNNQGNIDISALEREVQQIALNGPVVGGGRNVRMSIAVTSVSATLTAEEIIVETSLRGRAYKLGAFNKQINLASVGAGGMDAGAAPTNGFVAIYAIYNPTTAMSALLAVDATSAVAPEVYSGAKMPAGYEASALVSVWPTVNGLLTIGLQLGRRVSISRRTVLTTTTQQGSLTPLSIEATVPKNANEVSGDIQVGSSVSSSLTSAMSGSVSNIGAVYQLSSSLAAQGFYCVSLTTPQTIYYLVTAAAGTMNALVWVSGYAF